MLNGIDISGWQPDIDLYKVNVDFCIIKATQGNNYVSAPWCDHHVQQCRKRGTLWGFYHFADGLDPIDEANFFIKNTRNYFGEGIPVLDFEAKAVNKGVLWAKRFLDHVYNETGVRPIIYMSASVTRQYDWSSVAKDYALWVAGYHSNNTVDFSGSGDFDYDIGAWNPAGCAIWQFTSHGKIPGYNNFLDLNHAYITPENWKKFARPIDKPKPTPTPKPTPITPTEPPKVEPETPINPTPPPTPPIEVPDNVTLENDELEVSIKFKQNVFMDKLYDKHIADIDK